MDLELLTISSQLDELKENYNSYYHNVYENYLCNKQYDVEDRYYIFITNEKKEGFLSSYKDYPLFNYFVKKYYYIFTINLVDIQSIISYFEEKIYMNNHTDYLKLDICLEHNTIVRSKKIDNIVNSSELLSNDFTISSKEDLIKYLKETAIIVGLKYYHYE